MRLWIGETVEWFGGQVTFFALPSIAILVFRVGALDIGILNGLGYLAFPVLGVFVGVLGDRWPRRPMMVIANFVQVLTLGSIPVAFLLGRLTLYQLFAVATVMGASSVFFAVAYQSYLPTLVDRENLVEGNSKLQASESVAQIGGPALAGSLIQLFGAALSITVDALATLFAALAILSISKSERVRTSRVERNFFKELKEGLGSILNNSLLRSLAASTATLNLGSSVFMAVFFLFMYNVLKFSPGVAGLVVGAGGVGLLIGALAAPELAKRIGLGRSLAVALLIYGLALLMLPVALYDPAAPLLAVLWMLSSVGIPAYNINQISLRQAIVPDRLQGRMNATMRTIIWSTIPLGALVGGILGSQLGIVHTIVIGAIISILPALFILLGPLGSLHEIPQTDQGGFEQPPTETPRL